jgi:hypothetical protein
VALAVAATALLLVGARLLEQPTSLTLALGAIAVTAGMAVAAAAIAGAWRSPRRAHDDSPAGETR